MSYKTANTKVVTFLIYETFMSPHLCHSISQYTKNWVKIIENTADKNVWLGKNALAILFHLVVWSCFQLLKLPPGTSPFYTHSKPTNSQSKPLSTVQLSVICYLDNIKTADVLHQCYDWLNSVQKGRRTTSL